MQHSDRSSSSLEETVQGMLAESVSERLARTSSVSPATSFADVALSSSTSSPSPHVRRRSIPRYSTPSSPASPSVSLPWRSTRHGRLDMSEDHRLVIAIDYGTTFTGVAYATSKDYNAEVKDIEVVTVWAPGMGNSQKIPSVISYSPVSEADELQWGFNLSPDAVAMVNTKLELDVQSTKGDEMDLILQVLDGMNNLDFEHIRSARGYPAYTWKAPQVIVTDYLEHIFKSFQQAVARYGQEKISEMPIDIVITVPVSWSYRAKNSTLRAVRNAGFNETSFHGLRDIIMVTEPEAAAIYTARYLKEEKGLEFLKEGECFVLCDAGGGTVDVVSYKVKKLEPKLVLEAVTIPTGAKCGSIYIDGMFKRWLHSILGDRDYRKLDPRNANQRINAHATEGGEMRAIMQAFDQFKRQFPKDGRDMKMDLPKSLDNLTIKGGKVKEGQLTITHQEMESFFNPFVDRIIELIQGQITQIERKNNRVKNIFLVGGFSESMFLQRELEKSMRLRRIKLWRPETSWTAVVRGAVMFGIEKSEHKSLTVMRTCPRSYGLLLNHAYSGSKHDRRDHYEDALTNQAMAKGQLTWLITKGDLLLSNTPKVATQVIDFTFSMPSRPYERQHKVVIYEYPDDDLPDRFQTSQEELNEVAVLNCDFSTIDPDEFDRKENEATGRPYLLAHCVCSMRLLETSLTISITWNDMLMAKVDIKDETRTESNSRSSSNAFRSDSLTTESWRTARNYPQELGNSDHV